nr:tetratricopeptide repeat protein [Gammaproteobacteria bacterium]
TQNNIKNAEKYLLELNQNPDYEELAKYYLGLINQQSGNYEKALEYFAQLQNTENTEYVIKAKVRTAAILQSQKKPAEAKEVLLSMYPSDHPSDHQSDQTSDANLTETKNLVLSEIQLLYEQGLNQESYAILEDLKNKFPQDLDVTYSVGIIAKKLNNPELFEKNMNVILKDNPHNTNALSALGWYYFNNKNNEKALDLLQKAFEFDNSQNPSIGARLGAILWTIGQHEQANEVWKKMLELDPYNEALRDVIKKYQNN